MNKKIFILSGVAILLASCGVNKNTSSISSLNQSSLEQSSVSSTSISISSNSTTTSNSVSSSEKSTSSLSSISSISSNKVDQTTEVTIPLLNPGFSNQFVNGDLSTLINYINNIAGISLVKTSSSVSACQIMHVTTNKDTFDCLVIGTGSAGGSLSLDFNKTITKLELKVEAYSKPYTNQGVDYPNVDVASTLYVNEDANKVDLSTLDNTIAPTPRNISYELNSNNIKLYNKEGKNRVFIQEMKLTYKD